MKMTFSEKLKKLVENDLSKMMGKPVTNKRLWLWMVVDFFLIQLFIGPCNVLIWRGGWELYDLIFGENLNTGIILFILGVLLSIPVIIYSLNLSIFAEEILMDEDYGRGSFRYMFLTQSYSAVSLFVMLLFWKGWWDIWLGFPYFDISTEDLQHDDHWYFSLGCFVIGSFILLYLGCFKTVAESPPIGLWLNTSIKYVHVERFYNDEDEVKKSMKFRFLNAVLTMIIEVIALATYYGAFSLIDDWFHLKIVDIYGSTTFYASGYLLLCALLLSGVSYVLSILYLYIFYEAQSKYLNSTVKNLLYDIILLVSVVATAMHDHAWWEFTDVVKSQSFWKQTAYPELIFLTFGFLITIFLGVGSGNHFGITSESRKEQDGVLFPFIYLTYILGDQKDSEGDKTNTVVEDHIVHFKEESPSSMMGKCKSSDS